MKIKTSVILALAATILIAAIAYRIARGDCVNNIKFLGFSVERIECSTPSSP